jgi:transmembrane sensor
MNNSRFIELVNLYLQDRMTEREGHELAELLQHSDRQQQLEGHIYEQLKTGEFDLEEPPSAVFQRIQAHLGQQIGGETAHRESTLPGESTRATEAPVRKMSRPRWRYAAAAILLVLGGLYLYQRTSSPTLLSQEKRFRNDLQPGSHGAILTLSDGSRVPVKDTLAALPATGKGEIHVATGKRETWSLVLPDGTKVWLNASSSLRCPANYSDGQRHVELEGEAYFEVRHDEKHPFSVGLKDGSQVKDLGTRFNIHAYGDEPAVRTTVLEGAVQVEAKGHELSLVPGEQAEYSASEELKRNLRPDLQNVVAWKEEQFDLNATPINEIMRQVERWYGAQIVYQDKMDQDTTEFFGTLTRNVPVSQLLKTLEATGHVHFIIEGNKITVMK